ncbi:sulfite exporter TauE/SafE family protein [Methylomonas rivi]|uniref:Sulfite exporter TauE/SafE family protein n=1 Tax=Methylomonas rivi TaxID=2952226 RepID=A0ABT1U9N4_9GAMM|nr:sulfite exporter TauE/SafE family protein [Methylomonas sp. WSC-6]MCQ8130055.1 sulfite exporter TauE/SafE family protein [Methylomonas sp. WSC-6]
MSTPQQNTASPSALRRLLTFSIALLGIVLILWLDSWFMDHAGMPDLTGDVNIGLLLLIGFLTSFHCVGMCGPLILGYTAKTARSGQKSYSTHLLYGLGKTISYTTIGALFGAFGAIVAFTPYTQGAVGVAAGLFLMLFGLHMLEVFPALNHFQFKTPQFVMRFVGKEYRKHSNPFAIGLLNGLMIICGPLQAMYVLAAGTGSWSQGAAVLFFFGIGTLPLLLGFGFLTSLLSGSLTPKLLKASGVIVMALGVIMLNRGLSVTASGLDFNTLVARVSQYYAPTAADSPSCDTEQTIHMDVLKTRFSPNKFTLRKGIPVKWVINVKELNECNKEIVVRDYGLDIHLQRGEQIIEFTPAEAGVVPWSCWMGMIPGTFVVVEDVQTARDSAPEAENGQVVQESDSQRLLRQFKEEWQQLWSAMLDSLG